MAKNPPIIIAEKSNKKKLETIGEKKSITTKGKRVIPITLSNNKEK